MWGTLGDRRRDLWVGDWVPELFYWKPRTIQKKHALSPLPLGPHFLPHAKK